MKIKKSEFIRSKIKLKRESISFEFKGKDTIHIGISATDLFYFLRNILIFYIDIKTK